MSSIYSDKEIKTLLNEKGNNINDVSPQFHQRVQETLFSLPDKKRGKRFTFAAVAAVMVLMLSVSGVYGEGIIDFFKTHIVLGNSNEARVFAEYSELVGQTVSDQGVNITIDNVACDDNYLVLFYTASDNEGKTIKDQGHILKKTDSVLGAFWVNDERLPNGERDDAYLTRDGKIKGMLSANISKLSLPDNFEVNFKAFAAMNKHGEWDFKFTVSKAAAMKETRIVNVNKEYTVKYPDYEHHINIEKVSLTPFGNSIIISEKFIDPLPEDGSPMHFFALYDDKGQTLDYTFPSGCTHSEKGSRISFEFIKGSKEMKSLKLVPVDPHFDRPVKGISNPIGTLDSFPLELKVSDRGSVLVKDVEFTDTDTRIYYSLNGYVVDWGASGHEFFLLDENGQDAFKNSYPCQWMYVLDREKGEYVHILPPLDKNQDYSIGCCIDGYYDYLDDQAIEIPLSN